MTNTVKTVFFRKACGLVVTTTAHCFSRRMSRVFAGLVFSAENFENASWNLCCDVINPTWSQWMGFPCLILLVFILFLMDYWSLEVSSTRRAVYRSAPHVSLSCFPEYSPRMDIKIQDSMEFLRIFKPRCFSEERLSHNLQCVVDRNHNTPHPTDFDPPCRVLSWVQPPCCYDSIYMAMTPPPQSPWS